MNIIAIIPARAGSKRLPGKNIKLLADKPLLAHTIETALKATCFNKVIVSTESEEIANVAKQFGAEVPWLRSEKLATDEAIAADVVIEVLQRLVMEGNKNIDAVMLLQPTSPFRTIGTIHCAIELFNRIKTESVISVSPANTHPFWCKTVNEQGVLSPFCQDQDVSLQFQDLPPVYQLNGLVYLSHVENLYQQRSFYSSYTNALIVTDTKETVDIDNSFDWLLAETIIQSQFEENKK